MARRANQQPLGWLEPWIMLLRLVYYLGRVSKRSNPWCRGNVSKIGANESILYIPGSTKTSDCRSTLQISTRDTDPYPYWLSGIGSDEYTVGHKAEFKYFLISKHCDLVDRISPWHSAIAPKPEVKNDQVRILRDVPTHTAAGHIVSGQHARHHCIRQTRTRHLGGRVQLCMGVEEDEERRRENRQISAS